jgi:hypothetical protein
MRKGVCKQGHEISGDNVYAPSATSYRRCKICFLSREMARVRDVEAHAHSNKRWLAKRGGSSTYWRSQRYGLSQEDFEAKKTTQKNCCAICSRLMETPCVDHDHDTQKVRDLLCRECNLALGLLREDTVVVERLLQYLKKWKV